MDTSATKMLRMEVDLAVVCCCSMERQTRVKGFCMPHFEQALLLAGHSNLALWGLPPQDWRVSEEWVSFGALAGRLLMRLIDINVLHILASVFCADSSEQQKL